jgi:homogentisate 1,2-dioxygenase
MIYSYNRAQASMSQIDDKWMKADWNNHWYFAFFSTNHEFFRFVNTIDIHIAWIVYNTMHAHLKNCSQKLKKERNKFLQNLRSIINATQEKLKKYYDVTSSKKDLYFNLDLCLNSCDKLNYYKICYYNSLFSLLKSEI